MNIARRWFLRDCAQGIGSIALGSLGLGNLSAAGALKSPSIKPKAKSVIHLFMAGAPSQLELFDNKPQLSKIEGKPLPPSVIGNQRYAFIRPDAAVLGPRFKFTKTGQSGMEISEALPWLGKIADDICLIKSMRTDQFNHAPAQIYFNTGFQQPGRPSMGSWLVYGLGSETQNLPAFVVMSTGSGISGGSACWSSGFLPSIYSGVRFRNQGDPVLNISSPSGFSNELQRGTIDLIKNLNNLAQGDGFDPEIQTRIDQYEMAFRLQTSAPELMDLKSESRQILDLYGCDPDKPSFARACLLARRMIERGVRFVNIYHEGWDAHSNVEGNCRSNCKITDQASSALVMDLKQRGMLDDTLVIWGGEFGRTPMVETSQALGRSLGRDHHPQAFSIWLAGGGIKGGYTFGETDDLGFHIIKDQVHVRDLHATILHLLGFDHQTFSYKLQGLDFKLTGVEHASVVKAIIS